MKIQISVPEVKKLQQIHPSVNEGAHVAHSVTNLSMLYTFRDENEYLSKI